MVDLSILDKQIYMCYNTTKCVIFASRKYKLRFPLYRAGRGKETVMFILALITTVFTAGIFIAAVIALLK